jgi:hypothetical protein
LRKLDTVAAAGALPGRLERFPLRLHGSIIGHRCERRTKGEREQRCAETLG